MQYHGIVRVAFASLFLAGMAIASAALSEKPPGTVVVASPDSARVFFGSPSIACLSKDTYAVSYDTSRLHPRGGHTALSLSTNRGVSWQLTAETPGVHWATLFTHQNALWLIGIGTSGHPGSIQLRRSSDEGRSWTTPSNAASGLLLTGGKFHCAPTPVLVHGGRIWRAFEEFAPTGNRRIFRAFMLSAPADANLMEATNWTRSSSVACESQWLHVRTPSWLEGNAVATPSGEVVDILRVESHQADGGKIELPAPFQNIPRFEVAAMLQISTDGQTARFDPTQGFFHFIGSESKFTIRYDPVSQRYWTLANKITNLRSGADWTHSPHHQRNVIVLTSSPDLRNWQEHYRLLSYAAGTAVTKADSKVGFQYLDWQFEGDDIVAVSRTTWNGANYHDANYITFHRLSRFRSIKMSDSPPDLSKR